MFREQKSFTRVTMAGPLPPPVHGMATTNAAVYDGLRKLGVEPEVVDTGAPTLDRAIPARLKRITKVLRGLKYVAFTRGLNGTTLYMSISGGWGQVYETAFISIARLRGMRLFLRHASFAYLDTPSRVTRALIGVAGTSALHITQCQRMAKRLAGLYGASSVMPLSNAVLYLRNPASSDAYRQELRTLGFISNISVEKGVFEFLDLMSAAQMESLPINAELAGPFQDAQIKQAVMERVEGLENVEYVGPKYGAEKEAFFSSIDVFVFPTRYKNETEGKVNHEAMSHGIPVIAYGRGCIPEIVSADCGRVIDPAAPFVPEALAQTKAWLADSAAFEAASQAAARRFSEIFANNERRWRELLAQIAGGDSDGATYAGAQTEDVPRHI